jgi:hypothetical protein
MSNAIALPWKWLGTGVKPSKERASKLWSLGQLAFDCLDSVGRLLVGHQIAPPGGGAPAVVPPAGAPAIAAPEMA